MYILAYRSLEDKRSLFLVLYEYFNFEYDEILAGIFVKVYFEKVSSVSHTFEY